MTIITVTGYKGGVGKSTTAFHLAAYFADKGKTILIDGDANRTALKWAGRNQGGLPFVVADQRQSMKLVSGSDYIIIDTPARPDSDDLKELSKGCDLLILPTLPDVLSLEPMLETVHALGGAKYRALITAFPALPNKDGETMREELKEGEVPVFDAMIRRTVGFAKAALMGVAIKDHPNPRYREAWDDYEALGKEIGGIIK